MVALTASDPDFGLNSRLTYSLLGEDAAREEQEQFLLVLRAEDGGQDLSLSSSCLLTVLVEDENDNPPRLTNNPGTLSIPDNAGPGDFLYKLEVRDEDSGANSQLQYFLLGEAGRFSLDQNTGVITSRSNMGNVEEVFSLEVKVSDSGVPPLSTQERLRLEDSSSLNFPRWATSVDQIVLVENQLAADLPSVEANSVSGRDIQYRIVAGDLQEHFTIDPNLGILETVKPLDREHMESFSLYIGAFEVGV